MSGVWHLSVIKTIIMKNNTYKIKRPGSMIHTQRLALAGVLLALLAGCALPTRVDGGGNGNNAASDHPQMHAELIRDMLAQHQYYAALAHIQEMQRTDGNTRELRFLEAETRRKLGQSAAAAQIYESLLGSEYAGQSYHGLGLLNADRDMALAIQQLQKAVQLRPTDVQFRNDLGYALMVSHRYKEALTELATATELDQHSQLSRNNLIMLLFITRDEAGALRVARDSNVSDQELAGLRRQAQDIVQTRPARAGGVK